jgi:secondary thiamine-phosphate synthase enzyme
MITMSVSTKSRNEFIDITARVQQAVTESRTRSGTVLCFVPHTTAGITINENADPDVRRDILSKLESVFPQNDDYRHAEGNSDAHIKASLIGSSVQVIIEDGRLVLGTWQGIFFCEFDGPRSRQVYLQVTSNA